MLTVERVREVLDYDPDTGVFRWKVTRGRKAKQGQIAGGMDERGYVRIKIGGRKYRAHRLAWFCVHGYFPKEIDHCDLSCGNNKLSNLRVATHSQNCSNQRARRHNPHGLKGVSRSGDKWMARLSVAGTRLYLGLHATPETAHEAYAKAAEKHLQEFARST